MKTKTSLISLLKTSTNHYYTFPMAMTTLKLEKPSEHIAVVTLNRERKLNAMSLTMFSELQTTFESLSADPLIRVVLLTGSGAHFSSGIDLNDLTELGNAATSADPARTALRAQSKIKELQDSISSVEVCQKPVIAVIQGYCYGAGIDLASACDIRLCTESAVFSIKEIDIGMAADIGTLQRFPKIVASDSWARELAYTGRDFSGKEAFEFGFVSRAFPNYQGALDSAMRTAESIAAKSPVAVIGVKRALIFSRDHSVSEGLEFIAQWNSWALQCPDIVNTLTAKLRKETPKYPRL